MHTCMPDLGSLEFFFFFFFLEGCYSLDTFISGINFWKIVVVDNYIHKKVINHVPNMHEDIIIIEILSM